MGSRKSVWAKPSMVQPNGVATLVSTPSTPSVSATKALLPTKWAGVLGKIARKIQIH
jgi:hypothetical protein